MKPWEGFGRSPFVVETRHGIEHVDVCRWEIRDGALVGYACAPVTSEPPHRWTHEECAPMTVFAAGEWLRVEALSALTGECLVNRDVEYTTK